MTVADEGQPICTLGRFYEGMRILDQSQPLIGIIPGLLLGDSGVALSVMHYSNALPQSRLALIPKLTPGFIPINGCEWSYMDLSQRFSGENKGNSALFLDAPTRFDIDNSGPKLLV